MNASRQANVRALRECIKRVEKLSCICNRGGLLGRAQACALRLERANDVRPIPGRGRQGAVLTDAGAGVPGMAAGIRGQLAWRGIAKAEAAGSCKGKGWAARVDRR
jgi:hypothetical protein